MKKDATRIAMRNITYNDAKKIAELSREWLYLRGSLDYITKKAKKVYVNPDLAREEIQANKDHMDMNKIVLHKFKSKYGYSSVKEMFHDAREILKKRNVAEGKKKQWKGLMCSTSKPTKNHRPAIWESRLSNYYAMNDKGMVEYFAKDFEGAIKFSEVYKKKDLRLYEKVGNTRYSNSKFEPRAGEIALWVESVTKISEDKEDELPEDVIKAFTKLGAMQRGRPKYAMLDVQHLMGGGVLNPVVEHTSDLIHRMSHMAEHGNMGQGFVKEKTARILRYLRHSYGFEKEFNENIKNNAQHKGYDNEQDYKEALVKELKKYADEHRKLPAYNRVQWLAREASVAVGELRFDDSEKYINELDKIATNRNEFDKEAKKFYRDNQGNLIEYKEGM